MMKLYNAAYSFIYVAVSALIMKRNIMKLRMLLLIPLVTAIGYTHQVQAVAPWIQPLVDSLDTAARSTLCFVNKFVDQKERSEKFSNQINEAKKNLNDLKMVSQIVKELISKQPVDGSTEEQILTCADLLADTLIPALEQLYNAMETQRGQKDPTALSTALKPTLLNLANKGQDLKAKVAQLRTLLNMVDATAAAKIVALEKAILGTVAYVEQVTSNKMTLISLFAAFKKRLTNG